MFDESYRKKMNHLSKIPPLDDHCNQEFLWDTHPTDSMSMIVYHWGKPVMSLFLGEAIESAGYKAVMEHIEECNRTPWLHRWHKERKEFEYKDVIDILTKDYE
jgi:hypothetical protein